MSREWQRKKLGSVIEQRSGLTWSADQEVQKPSAETVPVLTVSNIQATLTKEPMVYLRNVTVEHRTRKAASKGWTIAVGSNGNRQRIGNCVFIPDDTEYLFASFLTAFRPVPASGVLPEYFFRWFSSYEIQARISCSAEGTTGLSNMSDRYLRNLSIDFPRDLSEQQGIVRVLRLVDNTIAATQAAIAAAERLQQGLMRELLAGRIRADSSARSAKDFWAHDRIGNVPHGWQVARLRDLFGLKNGKSNVTANLRATREGAFRHPVYGGNGMTGWSDRFLLSEPTVVIGRVGEYCGAVHATPPNAWVTDNALYVEERLAPLHVRFLFHLLTSLRLNRWKATTGQPKITQSEILNIRVAFPEQEDEQHAISDRLDAFHDLIKAKEAKITALQRLKKSLMQNLLTGKLRLSPETIAALNVPTPAP